VNSVDGAGLNVCVVIPTLNEADTIGDLIAELGELENIHVRAIIIDDGSTDGTLEIVGATSWWDDDVYLIKRGRKLGLGTAIRAGIMRALELDPPPDYIVTMDGDLSHDPQDIPLLVDMCDSESVIIGSRYVEGGEIRGWNASRHIISRVANIVARVLGRIPARDCTSGFRCYGIDLERASSRISRPPAMTYRSRCSPRPLDGDSGSGRSPSSSGTGRTGTASSMRLRYSSMR
jgi:glycosyltransferase involved in cell wall biosynthesis